MSDGSKKVLLKRHFASLELKIKILDRLKKGENVLYVANILDLNETAIRTIQKNEQKIGAFVASGCSISANMTARSRVPIIEKMEKPLKMLQKKVQKMRMFCQKEPNDSVIRELPVLVYRCLCFVAYLARILDFDLSNSRNCST